MCARRGVAERPWAFSESKYKGGGGALGKWQQFPLSFQGRHVMEIKKRGGRQKPLETVQAIVEDGGQGFKGLK